MVKKERYIGLGLDTDTAPDKRKTDTYWDAENIYIVNNARGLSVKPIKGETKVFDFAEVSGNQVFVNGYVVFMEVVYVFTTTSAEYSQIHKIEPGDSSSTILAYGDWNIQTTYRVDAVANYETDTIIKLYWVDGINPLRHINIAVTTGSVTRGIDVVDTITMSLIDTTLVTGGNLIAGTIQYVYNLYYLNGSQSNLSPPSTLKAVTRYFDGGISQEDMNLTMQVYIPTIDTAYDSIKIYSIHYQELNQSPKITLIYDAAILGQTSITIFDDGNLFIAELSTSDLLSITRSPIIPNTLAIKRDRLFVANYTQTNFDPVIDMRAWSFSSGSSTVTVKTKEGVTETYGTGLTSVPPTHDCINPDYAVYMHIQGSVATKGGTGPNIEYTYTTDPAYDGYILPKSLKQGEVYRIGIKLYNASGVGSPVKWVTDIKVPRYTTLAHSVGLAVTLTHPTNLTAVGVTSYQICIVERKPQDRTIISQGFIVPSVRYVKSNVPITPYYFPYYVAKDIVPSVVSALADPTVGAVPATADLHNRGGDISKSRVTAIDYDYNGTGQSEPQINHDVAFFYSSDTIFETNINTPQSLRVLGSAVTTLDASGHRIFTLYSDNIQKFKQTKTPYSTIYVDDTDTANHYPFGGPNCIMGHNLQGKTDPEINVFETILNKTYSSIILKSSEMIKTIDYATFTKSGESKVLSPTVSVSNFCSLFELIDLGTAERPTTYSAVFAGSIAMQFSSSSWHNSGSTYPYSDFDTDSTYGKTTGRALPMVELIATVANQYGGNSYEDKQRNEYLELGNLRTVNGTTYLAYVGDVYISKLGINRSDGNDSKINAVQNDYEYINLPYMENNHQTVARSDNMYPWSYTMDSKVNYNFFRIEDNHKLLGAYNQVANLFTGLARPYNFKNIDKYPLSILGSNAKNPNETLDSWLVFNPNNTKLLEGQYGDITKLHNLAGDLLAIQTTGIANIAVEPRILTQGSDGFQVNLGIGALLYDHRYLTTVTGSKSKFTITDDGKNLYYYDDIQNTINTLTDGKLSTLKTVKTLIDATAAGPHTATYFNKFDQVYFQFAEFTLMYDLLLQKFVSKYTFLNDNQWLIPNGGILYQIDETADTTTFYTQLTGAVKSSKITYLMCPDPTYEKVFHNLEYRLEGANFTTVKVDNERSSSGIVSTDVQTKFDIHRMHFPRVAASRERWRGIYVKVELNNTGDYSLDDMVLMYNIKG